ncbi:MAG: hypothetical protein WBP72_09190 [Rhodocyclaceae bacterium]
MYFSEKELRTSIAQARFSELAEAMLQCPGVCLGRSFGRECLKFGRRAFVVLDVSELAFLTGPASPVLLDKLPLARPWNPRNGRRPKDSWVASLPQDVESLGMLTLAAYEWVCGRGSGKGGPD